MSKKVKVLVSVLVMVVLLTVGGATAVMAQEQPAPTPETSTEEASPKGLLARVAKNLGVTSEELANAFKQARQEMKEEAFIRYLDKAVEEGLITQEKAEEIKEWWEQRPEALDRGLLRRACGSMALRGRHMLGGKWGVQPETRQQPWQGMMQRQWHETIRGCYRLGPPCLTD